MQVFDYLPNEKVCLEIAAIEKERISLLASLKYKKSPQEYCQFYLSTVSGLEFLKRTQTNAKLKILDIGFGRGETSIHLASQGHDVHSLDPSPLFCDLLQQASDQFDLGIKVYQGVAEQLHQIADKTFDLCIFNSSLHHCDEPLKCLRQCFEKLRIGGRILVINEPILKFYRSKKWFFKKLEDDPISLGHYGGNEHIYYFHEYLNLLRDAEFSKVKHHLHIQFWHPRLTVQGDFSRDIDGAYVLSDKKLFFKFMILLALNRLTSSRYLGRVLLYIGKRLSLFPVSFEGTRES